MAFAFSYLAIYNLVKQLAVNLKGTEMEKQKVILKTSRRRYVVGRRMGGRLIIPDKRPSFEMKKMMGSLEKLMKEKNIIK